MKAPIIVNESPEPLEPGCIDIFSSVPVAEQSFESWYADESYYACDADGVPLEIVSADGAGVWIVKKVEDIVRPDLAALFLRTYLASLPKAEQLIRDGKSEDWIWTATLEELAEVALLYATE